MVPVGFVFNTSPAPTKGMYLGLLPPAMAGQVR